MQDYPQKNRRYIMIYITQLVYIKKGKEEVFQEFEEHAIPAISKYNGKLLLRIRPQQDAIIENAIEATYEIHFVEFETEADFEYFKHDEERKKFLHLKEKSIQSALMIKGTKI